MRSKISCREGYGRTVEPSNNDETLESHRRMCHGKRTINMRHQPYDSKIAVKAYHSRPA